MNARRIWPVSFAVTAGALALAVACGGKVAPDATADSGVPADAAADAGYEGGWCSMLRGPLASGPAVYGDVSFCGLDDESKMLTHCAFSAGSKNPNDPGGYWGCCYATSTQCCPTAETSGQAPKGSCNGYGPGH